MEAKALCQFLGALLVDLLEWEWIPYFYPCYNKIPDESNLRKKGFLLSHSLKIL